MIRMPEDRLNKRIFNSIWDFKSMDGYTKEIKEDMQTLKITKEMCYDRQKFKHHIKTIEFPTEEKRRSKRVLSAEQRKAASERMKKYWADRKERGKNRKN